MGAAQAVPSHGDEDLYWKGLGLDKIALWLARPSGWRRPSGEPPAVLGYYRSRDTPAGATEYDDRQVNR